MSDLKTRTLETISLWAHDEFCVGGPECEEREALFPEEAVRLYKSLAEQGLLRTENTITIEYREPLEDWEWCPFLIYGERSDGTRVFLTGRETHGDALFTADQYRGEFRSVIIEERA